MSNRMRSNSSNLCCWFLLLVVFSFPHHSSLASAQQDTTSNNTTTTTLTPVVQDHVDWLVDLFNGADLNETDYQERFSPTFVSQVSLRDFRQIIMDTASTGNDWSVTKVELSTPNGAIVRIAPAAGEPVLILNLSVNSNGKINGALISYAEPPTTLSPVLQDHLDWLLALLNGADFNETEYEQRFSADFVSQVSANDFQALMDDIGQAGEQWSVIAVEFVTPSGVIVRIAPEDGEPAYIIDFTIDSDGKINWGEILPAEAPTLDDPPTTIEEAVARLEALGHNFAFVVAEHGVAAGVGEEICSVLIGAQEENPTPLGSMFKLYVLGAVVDAVKAGTIDWTQSVEIEDAYRSLPSGIVQNDPPNSTRTVQELAELMISISDNTATDHLMALVGRPAVEQALRDYGHHMPELNEPFLSTREAFILKLNGTTNDSNNDVILGPVGQSYLGTADAEERRAILSELENSPVNTLNVSVWTQPIAVEDIEWFASPLDLCNVLTLLNNDMEATRILAINPGVPDQEQLWSYIGFKGGSEPGVLGMAWYLEADDGTLDRIVTGTVWDPDSVIEDETEVVLLLAAIRDLSIEIESDGVTSDPTSGSNGGSMQTKWKLWLSSLFACYVLLTLHG